MRASSLAVVLLLAGCGDVVRAPITVVVDTDRGRALEEQGRLQELRVGVQGDRVELERARGDLQEARRRLEDAAADPAAKTAAAADIRALEARLSSLSSLSPSSSLTRAELDAALVASEQRLLTSLTAELDRLAGKASPSTSIASTATAPSSSSVTAAASSVSPAEEARALVATAKQRLRSKKLVVADLTEGVALVERVDGALARNDALGAVEVARRLAALADSVVVDRPLTRRRYERLNARTRDRAELQGPMAEASKAITAEDFVAANALLDAVETQLR